MFWGVQTAQTPIPKWPPSKSSGIVQFSRRRYRATFPLSVDCSALQVCRFEKNHLRTTVPSLPSYFFRTPPLIFDAFILNERAIDHEAQPEMSAECQKKLWMEDKYSAHTPRTDSERGRSLISGLLNQKDVCHELLIWGGERSSIFQSNRIHRVPCGRGFQLGPDHRYSSVFVVKVMFFLCDRY